MESSHFSTAGLSAHFAECVSAQVILRIYVPDYGACSHLVESCGYLPFTSLGQFQLKKVAEGAAEPEMSTAF
jgi:hypothetical protein